MRRISDGFNNVAHLNDLDPRYDRENDDVRDRTEFGEAPQREWIPRGTRIRRASTPPKGTWQAAVSRWLEHNGRCSYKACADAVVGMGHTGVTRAMVAEVMRPQPKSAEKAEKAKSAEKAKKAKKAKPTATRRAVPQYRPYVPQPRPPELPLVKIRYCDGCGLAISESGACRC